MWCYKRQETITTHRSVFGSVAAPLLPDVGPSPLPAGRPANVLANVNGREQPSEGGVTAVSPERPQLKRPDRGRRQDGGRPRPPSFCFVVVEGADAAVPSFLFIFQMVAC